MTLRVKLSSLILTEQEETMTDILNLNQTSGFCDDFESYRLVLAVLTMLSAMQRFLLIHECAMHMKTMTEKNRYFVKYFCLHKSNLRIV